MYFKNWKKKFLYVCIQCARELTLKGKIQRNTRGENTLIRNFYLLVLISHYNCFSLWTVILSDMEFYLMKNCVKVVKIPLMLT